MPRSADEIALLRGVLAAPADDLPRLVYADWLDDHDQPDRAEFIRLQCDRARRGERGIGWREYELLRDWDAIWREDLPAGLRDGVVYRRGFIDQVRGSAGAVFAAWQAGPLLVPVERLTVVVADVSLDWLTLRPSTLLPPLVELHVRCDWPVGPVAAELISRLGPYPRLQTLQIQDAALGNTAISLLRPLPNYPAVTHLNLGYCGLTDAGADALADSAWVGRLSKLTLTGNAISRHRLARLADDIGAEVIG